jgi:tyrosyl-DNA phosphodiesterase-1
MTDDDQQDMEAAIKQSLEQLKEDLEHQEREKEEMRQAIALSLGKPVENLTVRDTLAITLESGTKRLNDSQTAAILRAKKQKSNQETPKTEESSMCSYFDGVVKLTHVRGFSSLDYITIEQVLETKYLKKALLTAFVVSMDFVEQQFPSHINVCIVMHDRPVRCCSINSPPYICIANRFS